jgi:NADH:ubiquinone oxidoreductase subunit E
MNDNLTEILNTHNWEKGTLILILQKIQKELGYVSEEAISEIARRARISKNEVFGVASFYSQFHFTPRGKHNVKVCLGTSCHVQGGPHILEAVERELGITTGETTEDGNFNLESVACFGCCALSPVMVVDSTVYSRMTTKKVKDILRLYQ